MLRFLIGFAITVLYVVYRDVGKVILKSNFGLERFFVIIIILIIDILICYYVGDVLLFRYELIKGD